jgi:NADPH2:quinone reductase
MKAIICEAFGEPDSLKYTEVDSPSVRKGEVKIAVKACGVNFPDVLLVQGLYQLKPPFPFSPGLEVAGNIIELGEGVTNFEIGQRVMAAMNYGGFAEDVCVPAAMVFPMPENMSYEDGAAFNLVYGTSHVALDHRGKLQSGETLLVLGAAGGVGLTALELGKQMGATVIAAASTEEKLALTREYGADFTINYLEEDLRDSVKKITEGRYADVVYDPVGGDAFDAAVRCLGVEGRYLVIGFASGRIPEVAINRFLLKNNSLLGVYWGGFAFTQPQIIQNSAQALSKMYAEGKLKPYIDRALPLEQAAEALNYLANRKAKGKLILTT